MLLIVIVDANELFFQARIFCGNFKKVNKNTQWKGMCIIIK